MLLLVPSYLNIVFRLIVVPLSLLVRFSFARCRVRCVCSLSSCLGSLSFPMIWLSFLRSLLRRMYSLPLVYNMWYSSVNVFFACVLVARFFIVSSVVLFWRRCYWLAIFLSIFPFCPISMLFFSGRVPGLVWFDPVLVVSTAGLVADQLQHVETTNSLPSYV